MSSIASPAGIGTLSAIQHAFEALSSLSLTDALIEPLVIFHKVNPTIIAALVDAVIYDEPNAAPLLGPILI